LSEDNAVPDEDKGRVGIFPNWSWVYGAVLVYGVVVIAVLTVLSRVLSLGANP
jgi:hypothetical protein